MPRKPPKITYIMDRLRSRFGDSLDFSLFSYKNMKAKTEVICPKHGVFQITPERLLIGRGCWSCAVERRAALRLVPTEKFVERAREKHGDAYDYTRTKYSGRQKKVEISCKEHGVFSISAGDHLRGRGCVRCSRREIDDAAFVRIALGVHGAKYCYDSVRYTGANRKVSIICPVHGTFEQNAMAHLIGKGCGRCAKAVLKTGPEFVSEAKIVHGDRYDYSRIDYKGARKPVVIVCEEHGPFLQTPNNHLNQKSGCPKCTHIVSNPERRLMDALGIPERDRQLRIGRFIVDGYDRSTNTVYELDGDWWHGNPNSYDSDDLHPVCKTTFGELVKRTERKRDELTRMGLSVVNVWESDVDEFIKKRGL